MPDPTLVIVILAGALIEAAATFLTPRSALLRRAARVVYLDSAMPHALRYSFVLAPLVLLCILLFGLAAVVPRHVAVWVIAVALALTTLSFALTYRPPRSLLPAWFRNDLDAGVLPSIRPGLLDWLLLAIVIPLAIAGIASIPLLVFMGDVPG